MNKDAGEVLIIDYSEMLSRIADSENHLLLGNGFNKGLGIDTSYYSIFQKMMEDKRNVYRESVHMVEESGYDLEVFLGKLDESIDSDNAFLKKYVRNKVKLDFMQAAQSLVKKEIKNVYAKKNEGVFMLLKNFTNYFTLNYDSFLYLLLLNYKSLDLTEEKLIAIEPTLNFIEDDLNDQHDNMYDEIKRIRNGSITIAIDSEINPTNASIDKVIKSTFIAIIRQYSETNRKGWLVKDIERVVKIILQDEKQNQVLENIDDGAQLSLFGEDKEYVFDLESETQNLFFLHGAFHIYKNKECMKKITQQSDRALYDRLENVLNNEEQDIVCVFQTENKIDEINQNEYLMKCYNKLSELSGNLVLIGSALSDNDDHIFSQIENSSISHIYISSFENKKDNTMQVAKQKFPTKNIHLFSIETISYELSEEDK